jgi:hypothetical protein
MRPPWHFADIHGYGSATLTFGYLCIDTPDRLPPFALWPAFPTSDYYGGSDALANSRRTARLGKLAGASHVHDHGLCGVV